jgi:hypothetical protein
MTKTAIPYYPGRSGWSNQLRNYGLGKRTSMCPSRWPPLAHIGMSTAGRFYRWVAAESSAGVRLLTRTHNPRLKARRPPDHWLHGVSSDRVTSRSGACRDQQEQGSRQLVNAAAVRIGEHSTLLADGDMVSYAQRAAFSKRHRGAANRVLPAAAVNLSFDGAAAVPISGLTALQAVRDHGGVKAGKTC